MGTQVDTVTQAEYARLRGVSREAVSKAVRERRITLTAEGLIDPVAADAQWQRNSRVRAGSGQSSKTKASDAPGADGKALMLKGVADLEQAAREREAAGADDAKPGDDDYWKSRGRREAAEAQMAEIKLAEQQGAVIQVAAMEKIWSQRMAQAREGLMQLRSRLSPMLAVETDARKVDEMLAHEHDAALRSLAGVEDSGDLQAKNEPNQQFAHIEPAQNATDSIANTEVRYSSDVRQ